MFPSVFPTDLFKVITSLCKHEKINIVLQFQQQTKLNYSIYEIVFVNPFIRCFRYENGKYI